MVSAAFMRKYIHVAKIIKPILTQESAAYIAEEYSRLRSQDSMSSDTARVSPHKEDGPGNSWSRRLGSPCYLGALKAFYLVITYLFLSGLKGFLFYNSNNFLLQKENEVRTPVSH